MAIRAGGQEEGQLSWKLNQPSVSVRLECQGVRVSGPSKTREALPDVDGPSV